MGRVQLPNYPVPGEALSVAQLQKKVRPRRAGMQQLCCECGNLDAGMFVQRGGGRGQDGCVCLAPTFAIPLSSVCRR